MIGITDADLVRELRKRGNIVAVLTPQDIMSEHEGYERHHAAKALRDYAQEGIEDSMVEHALEVMGFRGPNPDDDCGHYGEEFFMGAAA